jgi:hypothetical protein
MRYETLIYPDYLSLTVLFLSTQARIQTAGVSPLTRVQSVCCATVMQEFSPTALLLLFLCFSLWLCSWVATGTPPPPEDYVGIVKIKSHLASWIHMVLKVVVALGSREGKSLRYTWQAESTSFPTKRFDCCFLCIDSPLPHQ